MTPPLHLSVKRINYRSEHVCDDSQLLPPHQIWAQYQYLVFTRADWCGHTTEWPTATNSTAAADEDEEEEEEQELCASEADGNIISLQTRGHKTIR